MITMWGLKTCDTCRKARGWLEEKGVAHEVRDVRTGGLDRATVEAWLAAVGADVLINRRGTTWRGLDAAEQARAGRPDEVAGLLLDHPSLIKRPVFVAPGNAPVVGFGKAEAAAVEAMR